jgi:uncharacterized membrane protein
VTAVRRSPYDRAIVALALPALGALAAEPLYLLADTAIVGHLGTVQLAALALAATLAGWRDVTLAALVGGIAGSTADSLLGATVQARRWCERCNAATEHALHGCGTATRVTGGVSWIDNDVVNALSTAAGGLIGLMLGR